MPLAFGFSITLFLMSWVFPIQYPRWIRFIYIVLELAIVLSARSLNVDLSIFKFIFFGKSYFLLGRYTTIALIVITAIPSTLSEYIGVLSRSQQLQIVESLGLDPTNPVRFALFSLATYTAASFFTIMLSQMLVDQQSSYQKIKELSEQVEALATTLERTRIAREIHDSLGHTLTDLDTQLAVAQTLRSQNPTQAFQAIDTAKFLARQCIEDVSKALDRMRQSDFDLNQALIALLEQLRETSTLQVQWTVNLPVLPIYQSYQIYCIVKEGLMNIQKHAQASQVSFFSHQKSKSIYLELKDNGIGFDLAAIHPGFGLQGMIERVQLLGGQLDIQTAYAQGTQIHITLPL
ncbi:sensor histidine kinase [Synechococcus sp. PCC 6312]|uniref:sensor histidine kinase n=1 Tax=Synechococcus sp. (strain ATCC 27167 / PCC 6312) TaxID=195253 RepID=UPI001C0FDCA2|nr:sensor histidine kinase [Synechococcus sp. PCC 6312]